MPFGGKRKPLQRAGSPSPRQRAGVRSPMPRPPDSPLYRSICLNGRSPPETPFDRLGYQTAHVFRHYDIGNVESLRDRFTRARALRPASQGGEPRQPS